MTVYTGKSSAGFHWDADGACYAVKLRRRGKSVAVQDVWRAEASRDDGIGGCLCDGFAALSPGEGAAVILGGDSSSCGFIDMLLPKLAPADLRNALKYELIKHAPLPEDALVWGYRVLGDAPGQRLHVRLIYLREMIWGKWLDEVSSSGIHADLILPATAVLDPLLHEADIFLADATGDGGFLLCHQPNLGRQILRDDGHGTDAIGTLPQPLDGLGLELGPLAQHSPTQQQRFLPAILLALYGLTREAAADRKTWVPLPYVLRPRRHRFSRALATTLAIYSVLVLGIGFSRWYSAAHTRLETLRAAHQATNAQIRAIERTPDPRQYIDTVQQELKTAYFDRPSLAAALLELTRLIDPELWMPRFTWQDGKIEIHLETQSEDSNLLTALQDSPILVDVIPTHKSTRNGTTTIRLQMHASFAATRQADQANASPSQANASGTEEQP